MDTNYVANRNEVLKNFHTLISYRNSNSVKTDYYKKRLKSGKTFIVETINNNIEFAPSKFVGYKNNTMEIHEREHAISRRGDLTDKNFRKLYGKRVQSDFFLDKALNSFYKLHNVSGTPYKQKAHIHYFILPNTLEQVKKLYSETPEFFSAEDIIKYSYYAGKVYKKGNSHHQKIGKEIKEKLYNKTIHWLDSISVKGYLKESKLVWQIGGHFQKYTWGKLFKKGDEKKLIYFNVGVHLLDQMLFCDLNCQRKSYLRGVKLTKEQVSKFDNFIFGTGAESARVYIDEIDKLNWQELIERTNNFIKKYDKLYDDAIKYVWGSSKIKQPKNSLEEVKPPDPQSIPSINHPFKGHKTDHIKRLKESKKLGLAGELLVIDFEKKRLKDLLEPGMKIEHTSREKGDGTGFDIKSYNKNGKEIFIEVKTTKSKDKNTQFNIAPTELEFSKIKKKSYWLYRVYNFNKSDNAGKVYRINGNLYELLDTQPDSYIAVFKGKGS